MKRRYKIDTVLKTMSRLREIIPNVQFTTDLMVGFPGETEEDFEKTLEFAKSARLLDAHVFCFSKREGTEAYGFDGQIEKSIKEERSNRLSSLIKEIKKEILSELILEKKEMTALVETRENGYFTAHSPSYIELKIIDDGECDLRGKTVKVIPVSQKDGILECIKSK